MKRISPLTAMLGAGLAFLYLPLLIVILYSFNASRLVTVWTGFSAVWYGELLRDRQMLAGAEVGVRDGLEALGDDAGPLIAAGYSYGAGLAVVAAAEAERWGIPVPSAVFGVFPYFVRGHERGPLVVPPMTTVTMLVGDRDQVVGERGAASIVESITPHPAAVRMLESDDACTYGHLAALQNTPAAQSAFWSPLDRIVDRLAPA